MCYRLEKIETIAQLQAVRSHWQQVCDTCLDAPQFLAYDWIEHSIKAFAVRFIFFIIYNQDKPIALAGFVVDKKNYGLFTLPYLRLFGNLYSPRSEIIFSTDKESVKSLLADQLRKLPWSYIEYGRTQDLIGLTKTNNLPLLSSIQHRKSFDIPLVDVRVSWEVFLAGRSQNLRKNIKKLYRDANQVNIEHHSNAKADFNEIFTAIEACSTKTWKHNTGTSLAASPVAWQFYKSILAAGSDDLKPLIILIKKEMHTIGFVFGTIHNRTLYAIKTGYDLDYEAISPGMLALTELMKYSCNNADIDYIDLDCVAGRGDYKYRFADNVHQVNDYYIFRNNFSGRLLGFIYKLKTRYKKKNHD